MANVKVGLIGVFDMLKFKKMSAVREKVIEKASDREITADYPINNLAARLHPLSQKMTVLRIEEHAEAGARTYVLRKTDGSEAAWFRAGQYVCVRIKVGDNYVSRPYSVSSSPLETKDGVVKITVKKVSEGFVSSWIFDNWKEGDEAEISGPEGTFYFERLRDHKNVIAVAGGSGITPFLSMAKSIGEKTEDFNLTVIFGSRTKNTILFEKEFKEICSKTEKVKVVHVLSDEKLDGYENGFITADLIGKYASDFEKEGYSLFVCGPSAMYSFLGGEIENLGLSKKDVRFEIQSAVKMEGGQDYFLTIKSLEGEKKIPVLAGETLLSAIEKNGIRCPSRCRGGECGWCRSKLLSGDVFVPETSEFRRYGDKKQGYVHPCVSFALSDVALEIPVDK